jgi:hypothetical protein
MKTRPPSTTERFEAEMKEIEDAVRRRLLPDGAVASGASFILEDLRECVDFESGGEDVDVWFAALTARESLLSLTGPREGLLRQSQAIQASLEEPLTWHGAHAAALDRYLKTITACEELGSLWSDERVSEGGAELARDVRKLYKALEAARVLAAKVERGLDRRRTDALRAGAFDSQGGGPRAAWLEYMAGRGHTYARLAEILGDIPPPPARRPDTKYRQQRKRAARNLGRVVGRMYSKLQE